MPSDSIPPASASSASGSSASGSSASGSSAFGSSATDLTQSPSTQSTSSQSTSPQSSPTQSPGSKAVPPPLPDHPPEDTTAPDRAIAAAALAAGIAAFERGHYRQAIEHLETAAAQSHPMERLGGEIQLWLVNAYAAGDRASDALSLCEKLSHHPDLEARKQGKRLLYILQAPKLKSRPEWVTQIPDLGTLSDDHKDFLPRSRPPTAANAKRRRPKPAEPVSIDWQQVETKDNGFLWLALGAIVLILGGLWWLS